MKITSEYSQAFGYLYDKTPKAIFAAIAFSLAFRDVEESSPAEAVVACLKEWATLHQNGIVEQKPPTDA